MTRPRAAALVVVAVMMLAIMFVHDTLLLLFAGLLMALVLRAGAEAISRTTRIPVFWSVWLLLISLVALSALSVALLGNSLAFQFAELQKSLPQAAQSAIEAVRASPLGLWLSANLPSTNTFFSGAAQLALRVPAVLSGAVGGLIGLLVIVFVGVAGALEPEPYVNGFISVWPLEYRDRLRAVLAECARTLRAWLLSRLLSMIVTGALVAIGLALLQIPLAGALGILAGLLALIPNIGALIAGAPAVLLAFAVSPRLALFVLLMYWVVHFVDDFIIAPLLDRGIVKLFPIVTLASQLILGVAFGAIGVVLAAPIVAGTTVIVRRLWIEGVASTPDVLK